MESLIETYKQLNITTCFCSHRIDSFKGYYEGDNEFWWCDVHEIQGVVFDNNEKKIVKNFNEQTGEFEF